MLSIAVRSIIALLLLLPGSTVPTAAAQDSPTAAPLSVRGIVLDGSGVRWFATDGEGLIRYHNGTFRYLSEQDGLLSRFVRTIQTGKNGDLLLTTARGIMRYDGIRFTTLPEPGTVLPDAPEFLKRSKNDDRWFGAKDGAYRFDGTTLHYVAFPIDSADITERRARPGRIRSEYAVYSVLKDKSGNIWFGTEQRGVLRYDGRSFRWFREKGLSDGAVRTIFQDRSGVLWFGNNAEGLFRYDGTTLRNITEEQGLGNPEFKKGLKGKEGTLARVWTITEDRAGTLWVGTIDAGLWSYRNGVFTNYTMKDGLPANAVQSLTLDPDGRLWIGTGNGICIYDGKKFSPFIIPPR
ncbi:MAG: hypothetical protein HUU02_00890 [Bacteroidetes bacterium]|nr:hypothetical protein [Bacteroidota bacterium]